MDMDMDMAARESIGIDWETSGPMKIINMANRLIQLPRVSLDG
jgi:hypothetical protein